MSPFLPIKLSLKGVEYICEQMDFLLLLPSIGRTAHNPIGRVRSPEAYTQLGMDREALLLSLPVVQKPSGVDSPLR